MPITPTETQVMTGGNFATKQRLQKLHGPENPAELVTVISLLNIFLATFLAYSWSKKKYEHNWIKKQN